MKIAVLVDENGNAVPYNEGGNLALYAYEGNSWHCIKNASLSVDEGTNISEIRARIHTVIAEIEDCKVFIVEMMKSLPIAIFDGYGITVWNHIGIPNEAFNFVKEQEENKVLKTKSCCDSPRCNSTCSPNAVVPASNSSPVAFQYVSEGFYTINLAKALTTDRTLNSKQILIPFFQSTAFQKLEIICDHVPKWFEREFGPLKLQFDTEESKDGLCHAIVHPKE